VQAATEVPKEFTMLLQEDAPLGFKFDVAAVPHAYLRISGVIPNSQAARALPQIRQQLKLPGVHNFLAK
jgi:hypothetical protein